MDCIPNDTGADWPDLITGDHHGHAQAVDRDGSRDGQVALPLLFIAMWRAGYVAGKLALPYAGPFTLLALRFGLAALLLMVALAAGAPWPRSARQFGHLVIAGLLIQALQFSSLYSALKLGGPAGESALIVGTMPIFTALGAGFFLGEHARPAQWLGMAAGVLGVALMVSRTLGAGTAGAGAYAAAVLALLGLTLGTLYQKKFCAWRH